MLSSDISVLDKVLPTLNDGGKTLILFCVQASPLFLTPVLMINFNRLVKFCRRRLPKVAIERPSSEIQKKVKALLEVKKLETCKALADGFMVLCLFFVFFVWIKSKYFGIGTIPAFDLCLIPFTLVWLCFIALYQSDMMPKKHAATIIATSYNTVLLYNQVLIRWLEVTDRDSLLLICRLMSGFMWGDHVKALAFQLPWIMPMLKTQTIPHANDPGNGYNEMWDIHLWEIFRQMVFLIPMWLMWFSVEYFVRQFSELMVQKADVNASLEAARSVLASQCDAEAFLRADLRFHNPSAKMAHFFGMQTEDLTDIRLVDLLDRSDSERFQQLVARSVQGLHGGQQTAMSLNLTFRHGSGRRIETQIYLGSIPALLGDEKPGHLIAFNEVRDTPSPGVVEDYTKAIAANETETKSVISHVSTDVPPESTKAVSKDSKQECSSDQMPLNADTLAFHAWSASYGKSNTSSAQAAGSIDRVNVVFDNKSLEVKEISLKLSTSNSKQRRKIHLNECIIPGVWEELQNWLEGAKMQKASGAPPIVPFVFPKFVTAALAARSSELSRIPQSIDSHGNSKDLVLSLSDIRLRRFQSGRSVGVPTIGRGTASHASRCSFDDQKL